MPFFSYLAWGKQCPQFPHFECRLLRNKSYLEFIGTVTNCLAKTVLQTVPYSNQLMFTHKDPRWHTCRTAFKPVGPHGESSTSGCITLGFQSCLDGRGSSGFSRERWERIWQTEERKRWEVISVLWNRMLCWWRRSPWNPLCSDCSVRVFR